MLRDRTSEWFVPKFGSRNFRVTIGLLFFAIHQHRYLLCSMGSLSGSFETERLIAVCVIYFLALGISAPFAGCGWRKDKAMGRFAKEKTLDCINDCAGNCIYNGMYYAFLDSPLLFAIGIAEGFFLFAYNLELFRGKFHNNSTT